MVMEPTEISGEFSAADGINTIAYRQHPGTEATVVFLHGFRSDMGGSKAVYLAKHCTARGNAFLRFDLRGHGQSSGHYTEFTIGDWLNDALQIIEARTKGPLVLVGSSLGAWLALRVLEERYDRVAGLVAIAPAVDFPTRKVLPKLEPAQRQLYAQKNHLVDLNSGFVEPTVLTRKLIEESTRHNLFSSPPPCQGPIRILQGMQDTAVPWQQTIEFIQNMPGADVELQLFKSGDHRLNEPHQQAALARAVDECLGGVKA
jgi:alpha-beta hydrolase superfamily lysophospholipase